MQVFCTSWVFASTPVRKNEGRGCYLSNKYLELCRGKLPHPHIREITRDQLTAKRMVVIGGGGYKPVFVNGSPNERLFFILFPTNKSCNISARTVKEY